MKRSEFRKFTENEGIVLLDGATGTNLQRAGMPAGVCPELWILDHTNVMLDLQEAFVKAGTQILYAPTFTGNRLKLSDYGAEDRLREINGELVKLSLEAAASAGGKRALVAGDMTMTGRQLYPVGQLKFDELVDIYKEQADALISAGCDLIVVETMMSLQETRAAVIAVRELDEDVPVMASLTFEADGHTLFGTTPEVGAVVLQSLGADVVGMNCSTGPEGMVENVRQMYPCAEVPVLAKPNAGLPELDEDGNTVYPASPEEFAEAGKELVKAGARIVGGCCGTTPEHIKRLSEAVKELTPLPVISEKRRTVTSERKLYDISLDGRLGIIGERINPTGKKKLQAELRDGKLDLVLDYAREQTEEGAALLDVNMGTNGIDEKQMMIDAVYEITQAVDTPLCIDSSFPEVIEAALRIYPGRALVNSVSWESEKFEKLIPVIRKYGAMFVFLPVSDEGIPENNTKKHEIIRSAVEAVKKAGLSEKDMVVDGIVATVGAEPDSAVRCAETISFCRNEMHLATVCGLSNISFGLPERKFVNAAFMVMAVENGLTLAIANPSQELLMLSASAADMLMAKRESDIGYINRAQRYAENHKNDPGPGSPGGGGIRPGFGKDGKSDTGSESSVPETSAEAEGGSGTEKGAVYQAVLKGDRNGIIALTDRELMSGVSPESIINTSLIPAINEVGILFDKKKYFLPQLIASANTMEKAIHHLEPMIKKKGDAGEETVIVIATVQGDVHDIGKNLVALMLRNYGYHVIDLGKDVPADDILDAAEKSHASVIGLSALMTTTMMRMKDVVEEASLRGYGGRIIIGGAAVTQSFADEIGADGYSKDAAECVRLVKRLLADDSGKRGQGAGQPDDISAGDPEEGELDQAG